MYRAGFSLPHCGRINRVLFESAGEVTLRDTGIADENGALLERQFSHPTGCRVCGKAFDAFIRVRFYHRGGKATIYDTGRTVSQEIGVAFAGASEGEPCVVGG